MRKLTNEPCEPPDFLEKRYTDWRQTNDTPIFLKKKKGGRDINNTGNLMLNSIEVLNQTIK